MLPIAGKRRSNHRSFSRVSNLVCEPLRTAQTRCLFPVVYPEKRTSRFRRSNEHPQGCHLSSPVCLSRVVCREFHPTHRPEPLRPSGGGGTGDARGRLRGWVGDGAYGRARSTFRRLEQRQNGSVAHATLAGSIPALAPMEHTIAFILTWIIVPIGAAVCTYMGVKG